MNDVPKEVMLHLLCFQALEIAEGLDSKKELIKSLRSLSAYTQSGIDEFEKTELGSEYQARSVHNFNVILNAVSKEILLTPRGGLEIEK